MIPGEPEEVDATWLSETTGAKIDAVTGFERIGTGQMSRNYRLELQGDIESLVIKVPASDPGVRALGASAYQREVYFYRHFAERIPSGIAPCLHTDITADGTEFVLVLADMSPASQGDQLAGCSIADAERSLETLATIHAALWNHESLDRHSTAMPLGDRSALDAIYSLALDQFIEHYDERLAAGTVDTLQAFRGRVARWLELGGGPVTVTHGDYRLDNLLYRESTGSGVTAVDWQTAGIGPPGRDVAYFLGNSLVSADRRAERGHLLEKYRTALAEAGVDHPVDELETGVAMGAWLGPLVTVVGAFAATRTDRGDEMFIAMADRCADQITQLESTQYLS